MRDHQNVLRQGI